LLTSDFAEGGRVRLEDLTVALRPRQPWEASDLGCALVQRDFGRILSLWLATVLPVWLLLAVALRDHPAVFPFVVWWLKPLYDRLPLHFISRATFGTRPGFIETWKTWPRLWSRFLFGALLWRRLGFMRSFMLPLWMLEGLKGAALQRRATVLSTDGGNAALRLTWVFVKLELAVFLGLLALTSFASPESGLPSMEDWVDGAVDTEQVSMADGYYWWTSFWYLVAITIVEPFYVGAGFGLYLNSRSKLEGWDIDLAFRKTALRLRALTAPSSSGRTVLSVILLSCLTAGSLLSASASASPDGPSSDGNALAKEILAEPEFKIHTDSQTIWVPTNFGDLSNLSWLGIVFEVLAYGLLAGGLIFLVYFLVHLAKRFQPPAMPALASAHAKPTLVMGMAVTPESLPADLLTAARAAWLAGDATEALRLLYRGALSHFIHQRALPIHPSDTEQDCLSQVTKQSSPDLSGYFRLLTQLWTRCAYASQTATAAEFDALCRDWPFTANRSGTNAPSAARSSSSTVRLLLGSLLCLGLLTQCNGRWEEISREVGFKGKARIDPFLAAQRFLEERGHDAERSASLLPLPEAESGLVITSAEAGMPAGRASQLLDWVKQGGHLVYALAGGGPYNDWSLTSTLSSIGYFGNDERPDPILEALGVTATDRRSDEEREAEVQSLLIQSKPNTDSDKDSKNEPKTESPSTTTAPDSESAKIQKLEDVSTLTTQVKWGAKSLSMELPDYVSFAIQRPLRTSEYLAGDPKKAQLLSLQHGQGRITLLPHARPLRNRFLTTADHGRLLDALAGDSPRHALFVIGLDGSFWQLLWQRGWRWIIGLALVFLFWLWMSLPRFGPIRAVSLHSTKRFADHLESLGHFFYRLRRQDYLLAAAQAALQQRLRETYPQLSLKEDQAALLAERSGLPPERVSAALADPASSAPSQIIRLLQDLQTLRLSLS
jgi:hypothetical protein